VHHVEHRAEHFLLGHGHAGLYLVQNRHSPCSLSALVQIEIDQGLDHPRLGNDYRFVVY
jgi:hypothetical protein